MRLTVDRGMVVQAVMDGQIDSQHVTIDELVTAHHLLADAEIQRCMVDLSQRPDVSVFVLDWQWDTPN